MLQLPYYTVSIHKSLDGKYLFIDSSSKETTEIYYLDLTDPSAKLQCVAPRRPKVLYEVEHRHGQWWISSNVGNLPDMALFTAPAVPNSQDQWTLVKDASGKELFTGNQDSQSLTSVSCFDKNIVLEGREEGIPRIWVVHMDGSDNNKVDRMERLTFAEDAYDVGMSIHYEFNTTKLVVAYDSLVTPAQSIEIDMSDTSKRTVLKEKKVPGYNKGDYACERTTVKSRDGSVDIPVSLVYRKDVMEEHRKSGQPVYTHLYGKQLNVIVSCFRSVRV
jgi:oligopeptidase B